MIICRNVEMNLFKGHCFQPLLTIMLWDNPPCVIPPVETDNAEVEDGGGRGQDVHRVPEVAQDRPEYPGLVHALIESKHVQLDLLLYLYKNFLKAFVLHCTSSQFWLQIVNFFLFVTNISRYYCLNSIHVLCCQNQNFRKYLPRIKDIFTSYVALKGITSSPTKASATAREAIR